MPHKLLIFIVAYNAQSTIEKVISRIPHEVFDPNKWDTEVLIIDDASSDKTFSVGYKSISTNPKIKILKNPKNLGYGGNQKLGYQYAIEHGFDFVALIHGDGQYAPEELPRLLEPLVEGVADAVFGSRMLNSKGALDGGMPLYKFIGNKVLTYLENKIVRTSLSEWHSGYRLYSVKALSKIPFSFNSNFFDFDTDIIIQLSESGAKIVEKPIPTFYGDEICHVNGLGYAVKIITSCILYRLQSWGIFYQAKFDINDGSQPYESKFDFCSSHSIALSSLEPNLKILSLGCGPLELVKPFIEKSAEISVVDLQISKSLAENCTNSFEADLDHFEFDSFLKEGGGSQFDIILALDVVENLKNPEKLFCKIRSSSNCSDSVVVVTTPNFTFFPVRLMFLMGSVNYGKRGILDKTHARIFTFKSLKRLFYDQGFEVLEIRGIPAPFPLAFGRGGTADIFIKINQILIKISKGLFSYQIYARVRPLPTVKSLLNITKQFTEEEVLRLNEAKNG